MNEPKTQLTLNELDSALALSSNLIRILDLAKDVSSLQGVADSARADLKALEDKSAEVDAQLKALRDEQLQVDADRTSVEADRAQASLEIARVAEGFKALDDERAARQGERNAHDAWAAGVRNELSEKQARVDSGQDQLNKREAALNDRESMINTALEAANKERDAADALKQSYEKKLDALRATVAG